MADNDWFTPKRFGYGAGRPIAWQGWALLGGYLALGAALGVVAAQHTRGGWKWRWGEDEDA